MCIHQLYTHVNKHPKPPCGAGGCGGGSRGGGRVYEAGSAASRKKILDFRGDVPELRHAFRRWDFGICLPQPSSVGTVHSEQTSQVGRETPSQDVAASLKLPPPRRALCLINAYVASARLSKRRAAMRAFWVLPTSCTQFSSCIFLGCYPSCLLRQGL